MHRHPVPAGASRPFARLNPDGCPRVARLIARAAACPIARPALEATLDLGCTIRFEDPRIVQGSGSFDDEYLEIVIADDLDPWLAEIVFIHEMRHAHQEASGVFDPFSRMVPSARMRAVVLTEADAESFSVLAAVDRRKRGDVSLWKALQQDRNCLPLIQAVDEIGPNASSEALFPRLLVAYPRSEALDFYMAEEAARWEDAFAHVRAGCSTDKADTFIHHQVSLIAGEPADPKALEICAERLCALPIGPIHPDPALHARARRAIDKELSEHPEWSVFVQHDAALRSAERERR